jgi:hypothetical protein
MSIGEASLLLLLGAMLPAAPPAAAAAAADASTAFTTRPAGITSHTCSGCDETQPREW